MIEQYGIDGKAVKKATCTIKTDDGATIRIRTSGRATKALMDGFIHAMEADQERRWSDD